MLKLSRPVRPCHIVIRKRKIHVWFFLMETREKAISNVYHVVLTITIPTATTARRLQGTMRGKYEMDGSAEGMWHCFIHGIPFVAARYWVSRKRILWTSAGLRNFNPLHHIATCTCITSAFNVKQAYLVLLHTPRTIAQLLKLKLYITCVCYVLLRRQAIYTIWSVFCLA